VQGLGFAEAAVEGRPGHRNADKMKPRCRFNRVNSRLFVTRPSQLGHERKVLTNQTCANGHLKPSRPRFVPARPNVCTRHIREPLRFDIRVQSSGFAGAAVEGRLHSGTQKWRVRRLAESSSRYTQCPEQGRTRPSRNGTNGGLVGPDPYFSLRVAEDETDRLVEDETAPAAPRDPGF
jgi:hypothetical protein